MRYVYKCKYAHYSIYLCLTYKFIVNVKTTNLNYLF